MADFDLTMVKVRAMLDSRTSPSEVLLLLAERGCDDAAAYRLVLERGADVNARNRHGATPLITVAACSGADKVLPALIEAGADVNATNHEGETALMMATRWFGGAKAIKVLLAAGANMKQQDKFGRTADYFARINGIATERQSLLDALGFSESSF